MCKKGLKKNVNEIQKHCDSNERRIEHLEKKEINPTINIDNYIQYHRTNQMRLNSHRQTLWEGQKHFTWWISIIISSIVLVLVSEVAFLTCKFRAIIILVGSACGVGLVIVACVVIDRIGRYFNEARKIVEEIETKVNPQLNIQADKKNKVEENGTNESKKKGKRECKNFVKGCFYFIYAIAGTLFVLAFILCLLYLIEQDIVTVFFEWLR